MNPNLIYRPEVDGLRTVAVMLVILHHLGWKFLSGGYVGVDVFFVISGYLITSIIYADIKNGEFSIARFYKRRIIRLAPAYFLVLAVTSIAALVFMLPAELLNYAKSVVYSTFFFANHFMWKEVGGYFGAQSEFVPLLHLWSLAVEEQFYIFWPLILFGAYRLLGKHFLLLFVLAAVIGGIVISEWGVQNYRAAAYYLLPTRFFELMVGALLVFLPRFEKQWTFGREMLSLTGLGLILYAATTYSTDRRFPGYSAIAPCLGAALILYFTRAKQGLVGKALSIPTMVYVGRISYPAYLWHWPIIAFLNLYLIKIDVTVGLVTLTVTLLLSGLTHRLIEIPFRSFHAYRLPRILGYGFAVPAVAAIGFSLAMTTFNGIPGRFSDELNLKSAALLSLPNKVRGMCNGGNVTTPLGEDECVLGVANRPVDFLLIGDSHANHFTGMFDRMAKEAGVRGYDITQSNTIYLPGVRRFYEQDGSMVEHKKFALRNAALDSLIETKKYKAVVLAGFFASHYDGNELRLESAVDSGEAFENGFRSAARHILKSGALVIVVAGNPVLNGVSHDCTMVNARFGKQTLCDFAAEQHRANFKKWYLFLDRIKSEFPSIQIIAPDQVMCVHLSCRTEVDGIPLYRDRNHLNQMGSELIGKIYSTKYGNPLSVLRNPLTVSLYK